VKRQEFSPYRKDAIRAGQPGTKDLPAAILLFCRFIIG
jgi:hypothetical protein